jgi:hypothetical protein
MSSSSGIQRLLNDGLLPSSLSQSALNQASAGQLNQMVSSSIALQQVNALFGTGSSSADSATLSPTANALLQAAATDPLTQAISNELTSTLNAAISQFLPQSSSSSSGSLINLLA